jgi:xanthine dehydrogenase accessory factor
MHDLIPSLTAWHAQGKALALATVVRVWGSAPRPIGSKMAVSSAGDLDGSVSGGCVEGAVFDAAIQVMQHRSPRLMRFGVSDEMAWSVGLSCGGEIDVYVEPFELGETPTSPLGLGTMLLESLRQDRTVALATVIDGAAVGRQVLLDRGGEVLGGDLGSDALNVEARTVARDVMPVFGCAASVTSTAPGETTVFVETIGPRPQLVIVGAVHVAIALVHVAKLLGYRTVVVDPRPVFAAAARFTHADVLLAEWPDEAFDRITLHDRTAIAVLSHDLKIDVPALATALKRGLSYVGALGSRKTQSKRRAALLDAGVAAEAIDRVRSPIGLALGGRRAEEVAVAIMAEIVAVTNGVARDGRTPPESVDH